MKAMHEVRKYEDDFPVWYGSYKNIGFTAHWHREIEIIYVKSGKASFRIDGKNYIAKSGDMILCDSIKTHVSSSFNMENSLEFLLFDTSLIGTMYHSLGLSNYMLKKEELMDMGLYEELKRLLKTVKKELLYRNPYYKETVKAAICYFWYLLKRNIKNNDEKATSKRAKQFYDMHSLLEYLNENFTENITLEDASKFMGLSECHFSRVFKQMVGISFVTYLNTLRVENAAKQMMSKSTTILDIALSSGFNNIRTFNRTFKSITGYTPMQFSYLTEPEFRDTAYFHTSVDKFFVENDSSVIIHNK